MAMTEDARVRLGIDGGQAVEDQIKALEQAAAKATRQLNEMGKGDPEARKSLRKDLRDINGEVSSLKKQLDQSKRYELIIDGKAADVTLKELESTSRRLYQELRKLPKASDEFTEKSAQYRRLKGEIDDLNTSIKGSKGFMGAMTDSVKQFGVIAAGYLGFQFIKDQVTDILRKNAALSDSIAKIERTTGLATETVKKMISEVSKIDTRTTKSALLDILAMGGQFNVAKDQMVDFTEQVDKVNVVLGDEFKGGVEEVTTQVATLRNVLFDFKTENIANDIGKLSNALVTLSAEGVATAPVITDMSTRMAGTLIPLGATSAQVLGIAASLQELGVSTERGSTAITKIFQKMAQNTSEFAAVAGKDAKEFKRTVDDNLIEAFYQVIEGSQKSQGSATRLAAIVKDLEISGAGASEVFSKFSQNMDLVRRRVDLAGDSMKNQDKINKAFIASNTTFGAELDKLGRKIYEVFTNGAVNDFFKGLISGVNKFLDTGPGFKNITNEWLQLNSSVKSLDDSITPLLNRYEVLTGKTTLTAEEQAELKSIIDRVGQAIPTAIARFDEYGKALEINTSRAKDFIASQQQLATFKNKEAIAAVTAELKGYDSNIKVIQASLEKISKTGTITVYNEASQMKKEVAASNEDVSRLQTKLAELQAMSKGAYLSLKELHGMPLIDDRELFKFKQPNVPYKLDNKAPEPFSIVNSIKTTSTKTETKVPGLPKSDLTEEEREKLEEAIKLHESYVQKIQALQTSLKDIQLATITEESERELAILQSKFEKEIQQIQDSVKEINKIKGVSPEEKKKAQDLGHANELAAEDRFQQQRTALILKHDQQRTAHELDVDLGNLKRNHDDQMNALVNSLFQKKITKEQYEQEVRRIEKETLAQQLIYTQDYEKQALANLKLFEDTKRQEIEAAHSAGGSDEKYQKDLKELEATTSNQRIKILQEYGDKKRQIETGINNESLHSATTTQREFIARENQLLALRLSNARDGSREQLNLLIDQINLERQVKIDAAEGDAEIIAEINKDSDNQILEAKKDFIQQLTNLYVDYLGSLENMLGKFTAIQNNHDKRRLAQEQHTFDQEKQKFDTLLNKKLISQKEYDRHVDQLEEEHNARKGKILQRQFKRDQQAAIGSAVIAAAAAAVQAWSTAKGNPYVYAILAALITATAGLEIAKIKSEPVPEYERGKMPGVQIGKGGIPEGPSHQAGGIELVHSQTGKKIGEMQGDEAIIPAETSMSKIEIIRDLLENGGDNVMLKDRSGEIIAKDSAEMADAIRSLYREKFELETRYVSTSSEVYTVKKEELERSITEITKKFYSSSSIDVEPVTIVSTTFADPQDQKGLVNKGDSMRPGSIETDHGYVHDNGPQRGLVNKPGATETDHGHDPDIKPQKGLVNRPVTTEADHGHGPDTKLQKGLVNRSGDPGIEKAYEMIRTFRNADQTSMPEYSMAQPSIIDFDQVRENLYHQNQSKKSDNNSDSELIYTMLQQLQRNSSPSGSSEVLTDVAYLLKKQNELLVEHHRALAQLNNRLQEGIEADLVYTKFDRKIKQIKRIQSDSKIS